MPALLSWQAAEKAITDWVIAAAPGVTPVWAHQARNPPPYPYLLVNFDEEETRGATDGMRKLVNLSRTGQEIELRALGRRMVTFQLEAIVAQADMVGNASAKAIAGSVRDALAFASVRDGLKDAGLYFLKAGPVRGVPTLVKISFEGRARVAITFNVTKQSSTFLTYIKGMRGTIAIEGAHPTTFRTGEG